MTMEALAMLAVIIAAAFAAPFLADRVSRTVAVPPVVVEVVLGILVGPAVLDLVSEIDVVAALSDLGLAFLMFLAGYEIEFGRIRGGPLRRAISGWLMSLALGITAGLLIGGPTAGLVIGLALTTTALGTILPIVRDSGDVSTPFGDRVLAVGATGEFGPIVAIAFVLSTERPAHTLAVLAGFALLAFAGAALARRPRNPRLGRMVTATLGTSAQVGVRLCVLVVIAMFAFAEWLGLDPVLGAFTAGILVHLFLDAGDAHDAEIVHSRLEGIGFGFFIPIFFVVSGAQLDLESLLSDPGMLALVPIFAALLLAVRGIPTLVSHIGVSNRNDQFALALFASTGLPLIVVITNLGVDGGLLRPATAAALVGAGIISLLVFPTTALRLRQRSAESVARSGSTDPADPADPADPVDPTN